MSTNFLRVRAREVGMSWFGIEVDPDSKEFKKGWKDAGKGRTLKEVLKRIKDRKLVKQEPRKPFKIGFQGPGS